MSNPIDRILRTGQICPADGFYVLDEYTDGSRFPSPTEGEHSIQMKRGRRFPPVRSACKGAVRRQS
jgi:hypothetical protein